MGLNGLVMQASALALRPAARSLFSPLAVTNAIFTASRPNMEARNANGRDQPSARA